MIREFVYTYNRRIPPVRLNLCCHYNRQKGQNKCKLFSHNNAKIPFLTGKTIKTNKYDMADGKKTLYLHP